MPEFPLIMLAFDNAQKINLTK